MRTTHASRCASHAVGRVEANDRKWLEQQRRQINSSAIPDERAQLNAAVQGKLKLKAQVASSQVNDTNQASDPNARVLWHAALEHDQVLPHH